MAEEKFTQKIDEIITQAKQLENTDDYDKAVMLYKKAAGISEDAGDVETAVYYLARCIKILRRENELYQAGMIHIAAARLYDDKNDRLNAARNFSRAGTAFVPVSAFSEAASAYEKSGDAFFELKDEFYVEAAKHYKLASLEYLATKQRQFVEYRRNFSKALDAYKEAENAGNITYGDKLLYITNVHADIQEALARNGFYNEEKNVYIKKMDYVRLSSKENEKGIAKYVGLSLWKYTCLYGESPGLWLLWICGHILFFAGLFHGLRLIKLASGAFISFMESIFFSVDIFATLGFGDYTLTSDFARFMVGIDVLSGYFMMAMLITIFARKLTR